MIRPGLEEFKRMAERGNLIPVFREQLADTETPVSVLARFADEPHVFLLESVEGGENWGRFSVVGINPAAVFMVRDGQAILREADDAEQVYAANDSAPLFRLREILAAAKPVDCPELPRFFAGAVGYIGYETINQFEQLPPPKTAGTTPETCMMLAEDMIVFDNVRHTMIVIACARTDLFPDLQAAYRRACGRVTALEARLRQTPKLNHRAEGGGAGLRLQSNMTQEQFQAMVEKARRYITDGDIIQAVLSQRFTTATPAPPLSIYRALRLINPSPYLFFIKNHDHVLIGSSPEIMVKLTNRTVELRPIAGTRPRGRTEQEDRALADDLLNDAKERAEHVMLVDLGRNDLGRIAATGSVQVRDFMTIERYSHVMHIVSHLQAELKPELDGFDLLAATFPAGTLSGAPKIRAMEIIHELEPQARGVYGGAVGYLGYNGDLDLAIAIRTLEVNGQQTAVQAGAGIVADSDPHTEFQETRSKARGMMRALELAARNLELHHGTD